MVVNYALDALLLQKDKKTKDLEEAQRLFQQIQGIGVATAQAGQVEKRIASINSDLSSLNSLIAKASGGGAPSAEEQLAASAGSVSDIAASARENTNTAIDRVTKNYEDYIAKEKQNAQNITAGIGASAASQEGYAAGNANKAGLPLQVAAAQSEQVTSTANQQIAQAQALSDQKILQAMNTLEQTIVSLQANQSTNDLNAQKQLTDAMAQYNALKQYQAAQGSSSGTQTKTTVPVPETNNIGTFTGDPTKLVIVDNKTTLDNGLEYTIENGSGGTAYLVDPSGKKYIVNTGYNYTGGSFVPITK